jgi:hypothetical protein
MEFLYNITQYTADNIMGSHPLPAHSGPELCASVPEPKPAKELAQEVMMDRLHVVQSQYSFMGIGSGTLFGLRLDTR